MSSSFDPYHRWLSIPPEEQPPDYYRLLGLRQFEGEPEVIQAAADRQMSHLRTYQAGPHAALSQKLLNELAAARVCLLNAGKKAAYDARLREALGGAGVPPAGAAVPPPPPIARGAPPAGAQPGQATAVLEQLGEYKLLEKLGSGGMGTVYKAVHVEMDRVVAVKVLPANLLADERAVARFKREIKAVAQLKHPNVVEAYDAREIEGTRFLVMEYVEGTDVARLCKRLGPLPAADACEIVRQAALGLQSACEHGLVHRDVKPGNLMLTPEGRVKLLDLGLARAQADENEDAVTGAGEAMGTVDYMAPEQIVDSRAVDIRADVYSLGCTLYRLLAGHPPFSGPEYDTAGKKLVGHLQQRPEPIAALRPDLAPALALLVERMMAKQPDQRFATPGEVAAALKPFAADARLRALAAGKPHGAPAGQAMQATAASQSAGLTGFLRTMQGKKAPGAPSAAGRDQHGAGPPHAPAAQRTRANPVLLYGAMAVAVLVLMVALGLVLSGRRGQEVAGKSAEEDEPAAAQATLVLEWPAGERRGAKVSLNGRDETALVRAARGDRVKLTLKPGKYAVRIERPGYEAYSEEATLAEGRTATVAPAWKAAVEKPQPSDFPDVPAPKPGSRPPEAKPVPDPLPRGQWIDLTECVDADRDRVTGAWQRDAEGLRVGSEAGARLMLPGVVAGSYDLEVEFTRHAGRNSILVFLPVEDAAVCLAAYVYYETIYMSGLCAVDGKNETQNPSKLEHQETLPNGRRCKLAVQVRLENGQARIASTLDGQPFVSWSGRPASLSVTEFLRLPEPRHLGVGAYENEVVFHAVRLRLLSDAATPQEKPAPGGPVAKPGPPQPPLSEEERRKLAAREALEKKYQDALQPVEVSAAAWDLTAAQTALEKVKFDEPELQTRLSRRADELARMAALKSKIIARIKSASPRLRKSDLMLRGMNGEVAGADQLAIHVELAGGKTEDHPWGELNEKARPKLLELAVDEPSADDWLAAGLMAFAAGDVPLAERLLDKARSLGTDIGPYLGPLAAGAYAQAKGLIEAGKWIEAQKRLDELQEKYGAVPWLADNRALADEAIAAVKAGIHEAEAEKLYAEAKKLFEEKELFDVRDIVHRLKADYPQSRAVTDAARQPSFAEMAQATASLTKRLTVRLDGKGDFKSIQAAIDAAPPKSLIEIRDAGPYRGQVSVPAASEGLTIRGARGIWPVVTSEGADPPVSSLLVFEGPGTRLDRLVLKHCNQGGQHVRCLEPRGPADVALRRCLLWGCTREDYWSHVSLETCVVDNYGCIYSESRVKDCVWIGTPHDLGDRFSCDNVLFPRGFENGPDENCQLRSCTIGGLLDIRKGGFTISNCIVGSIEASVPGGTIEYCCAFGTPPFGALTKPGKGCLTGNPMFADPKNFDYRLLPGSPCRGKASDGGDIGVRYTPEMIEMLKLAFELRAKGTIKF